MVAYENELAEFETFDVPVEGGSLRAHRFGPADGDLVICVPGIAANSHWFDRLAAALAGPRRRVVTLDLRGRGHSSITPPGTYGFARHARDVYSVARALRCTSFDYVGHSMGAYVGMEAGSIRDDVRLRRLVLVDGLGVPRLAAVMSIVRALERLGRDYESAEAYVRYVRNLGLIKQWNPSWQRAYEYELVESGGRVRSRTQKAAAFEDVTYGYRHDARRLWRHLPMPVLALRATDPIAGRTGFIVPAFDLQNFARIAPRATVAEIAANHYDIIMHDHTLSIIRRYLDAA